MRPAANFYDSPQWKQVRRKVLNLYGHTCMNCGLSPKETGKPVHVDHIKPRTFYPQLSLSLHNLQVLCEDCNCGLKGTLTIDFRTEAQLNRLNHRCSISKQSGKIFHNRLNAPRKERTEQDLLFECKREIQAIHQSLTPRSGVKKTTISTSKATKLINNLQEKYSERVVSLAIQLAGFRS